MQAARVLLVVLGLSGAAPQCPLWFPPLAVTVALAHMPQGMTGPLEEKEI